MKKILLGSIALAALTFAGSAQAADMGGAPAYRAPPPVAAPSWTGFYLGAGVGLRSSRADATSTAESLGGVSQSLAGSVTTQPLDGTGFRASPYIGFNWQFAPQWIAGIEGDFGFAGQTTTLSGFISAPASGISNDPADNLALRTTWDASLRGRLGLLLTPATLAYMTAGVIWQHYEVMATCADSFCVQNNFSPAVVVNSTTKAGWTVGGGIETMLWSHWSARAEYRYADFGSAPFTITRLSTDRFQNPSIDNFEVTMRTHTVTFGLAYKFN